jgi:hypothetical protein
MTIGEKPFLGEVLMVLLALSIFAGAGQAYLSN